MTDDTLRRLGVEISAAADEACAEWVAARDAWNAMNVAKATSTERRKAERRVAIARGRVDAYTEAYRLVQSYRDGDQS